MNVRKTELRDLKEVLTLFKNARQFMKENNNDSQWVNGYPQSYVIEKDILDGKSYIAIDEDEIVATFYFAIESDPTYLVIDKGGWLNNSPYGVIHRITTNGKIKGVGAYCIDWCYEQCHNLRVDTHKNNIPMHNLLLKCGFSLCGIIYIDSGDERNAYQKS